LPDRDQFLAGAATDEWWREALLLTVGSLGSPAPYEQREAFAAALCAVPAPPEAQFAAAELCATGLLDLSEPEPSLLAVARQRLAALLTNAPLLNRVPPPRRAMAADALARLGDPRPEVTTIEGIQFCYVPPGPFWMGEGDGEHLSERLDYGYWMARYPVTVAQFRTFVGAGGYRAGRYWTEARAAGYWKEGLFQGRWDGEPRDSPYDFGQPFDLSNHPVVGLSWYEALAFCRWLAERLGGLPAGYQVRLPGEAEWEKAARGGVDIPVKPALTTVHALAGDGAALRENPHPRRVYPWGDEPGPNRANYDDTGIGTTSAVGCFPGGAGPCGVEDLSGNVWEWCQTQWRDSYAEPADESLAGTARRVLRGGSFLDNQRNVRCACRSWDGPDFRYGDVGFRVVVAPVAL
jgi:formylglycine-generating enzyme required for sulfatase activity